VPNVSSNQNTFQFDVPTTSTTDVNDPTSLENILNEAQQRFEF
jgi:hypothetical protein